MRTLLLIVCGILLFFSCNTKSDLSNSADSKEKQDSIDERIKIRKEIEKGDSIEKEIREGALRKIQNGEDMVPVTADYYNNYERQWYKMDLYIVPVYTGKGLSMIYVIGYGFGSNVISCEKKTFPIGGGDLRSFVNCAPYDTPNFGVKIEEEDIKAFFRYDGISQICYNGKRRGDY